METASTEVTSIRRRNNVEKSTRKTNRCFVDFESRIHVEISALNRCHNFRVDSPFKIDVISTNFPRGISTSNRWRIDEDVSIGMSLIWVEILHECFLLSEFSKYKRIYSKIAQNLLTTALFCLLGKSSFYYFFRRIFPEKIFEADFCSMQIFDFSCRQNSFKYQLLQKFSQMTRQIWHKT